MITETQTPQVPHPLLEMRIRQLQMLLSETTQQFNSRIFNNTPENLTIEQVAEISVLAEALFVKISEYIVPIKQAPFTSGFMTRLPHSPQERSSAHPDGVIPVRYPDELMNPPGF